jgi:hypothetical protein
MGLLGDIFSTIDSAKRRASAFGQGLLSDPVETIRQQVANNNNEAGQNLDALGALYKDGNGNVTFNRSLWSPQAIAANDSLTNQLTGAMMGATVWHGSPHAFNKFDSSKIGTGEGAQVYGHGLYLADSPDVAKHYSTAGEGSAPIVKNWLQEAADAGLSGDAARQWAKQKIGERAASAPGPAVQRRFADAYERFDQLADLGNVYKVDLPDKHIARMIDYDNAVPEPVRQSLSKPALEQFGSGISMGSGEQLMRQLASEFRMQGHPAPNAAASEWLSSQGIPGLKYLDGQSRAQGGTSNYVVFPGNENMLTIQQRNGQPLP